jgi:hypothetical protein
MRVSTASTVVTRTRSGGRVLDHRSHQGKFGEDYIRALASAAGLLVLHHDLDRAGVDIGMRFAGPVGRIASPMIEAQVKTWSRPKRADGELLFRGLNERQYNQLAGPGFQVPRYLFVVLTPSDRNQYVECSTEGLLLRHLCFFRSLEDEAVIEDPSPSRHPTVRIPEGNVLTVRTLRRLVHEDLPGLVAAR